MDRRQNNGSVKAAVSLRHCRAATTSTPRSCCFNCRAGLSHKDNIRCTTVEEQPEAKEVHAVLKTTFNQRHRLKAAVFAAKPRH